jgi:glucose/arabinose dehydrogenase
MKLSNQLNFCLKTAFMLLVLALPVLAGPAPAVPLANIKLPPGFKIELFCENIPSARQMVLSPKGTLFVGTLEESGKVYAVLDQDKDGKADKVVTIAKGLFYPNGVAFRDGSLYVAEINRILRYDNIEDKLDNPPPPVVVYKNLPRETHHGWKYIRFGPDGLLYVPIGAPCNICVREDDPRFGSLCRMNVDGTKFEIYAKGIRNTVGFDWQPVTKELWFTDNGRDLLGDNIPPDELNYAPHAGMNFGFPFRYGKNVNDPTYGSRDQKTDFVPCAMPLGPHVASLGVRFYDGKMFPKEYQQQALICEHGSWNRKVKFGYRVTLVTMKNNKPVDYKIFAEGWLNDDKKSAWGRPVDLCLMPDGAILVSDDAGGRIYRITYNGKAGGAAKLSDLKSAYPTD